MGGLFVGEVGVGTEISWSFILVQINCQNHPKTISFVENEKWVSGSGMMVFLFMGTLAFGVPVQSHFYHHHNFSCKSLPTFCHSLRSTCRDAFCRIDTQPMQTIQDLLESSNHVHTEANFPTIALSLSQCQICLPNLVVTLVLSTSLCDCIYTLPGVPRVSASPSEIDVVATALLIQPGGSRRLWCRPS